MTLPDKFKLPAFLGGLALILLGAVSAAANHKADTLGKPANGGSVVLVLGLGVTLLFLGRGKSHDAAVIFAKMQAEFEAKLNSWLKSQQPAQPVQSANKTAKPAELVQLDKTLHTPDSVQQHNLDAIFHLAAEAATVEDTERRKELLKLCRAVNDKFFVLHHVPEGTDLSNDPQKTPPKPPAAAG